MKLTQIIESIREMEKKYDSDHVIIFNQYTSTLQHIGRYYKDRKDRDLDAMRTHALSCLKKYYKRVYYK